MQPLSVNLAIIFGSRLVINNFISIVLPWIALKMKISSETKNADASTLSRAEKDYMLSEYIIQTKDLQRMADVVIEYGYMILFIVALPISCGLSMVNSIFKVKFAMWSHVEVFKEIISCFLCPKFCLLYLIVVATPDSQGSARYWHLAKHSDDCVCGWRHNQRSAHLLYYGSNF